MKIDFDFIQSFEWSAYTCLYLVPTIVFEKASNRWYNISISFLCWTIELGLIVERKRNR
jgi:hypothetical protein